MQQVLNNLLAAHDLSLEQLYRCQQQLADHQVDFADYYFQFSEHESWVLEDGIIKNGSFNIEKGMGVRAVCGDKTGFAYTDELSIKAIDAATKAARTIAPAVKIDGQYAQFNNVPAYQLYQPHNPLQTLAEAEKIQLLRDVDQYVRDQAPNAEQVNVSLTAVYEEILVLATDGTLATDIRPLVRLNISILLAQGDKRERGSAGAGGRRSYLYFTSEGDDGRPFYQSLADEAIHMALVNLQAQAAPAGEMPVVLGAGWPGVLLHEAVGHGLEGDFNRKGSSTFANKLGQRVAAKGVTVVDDGTMPERRGSLQIDDEGTLTQRNVLIEDGILVGYMQDKLNAKLMHMAPTGNGRRESYAHLPMPRMTNTFMENGEHCQAEMIASIKKGIFAPNFGGGQVDITSGKFVFNSSEAYLIENGKVTAPIKGATLIGSGPQVMQSISMIGNDLALDKGVGVCGKDGQSVPVGVGQPSLKVDAITVGGTD